MTLQCRRARHNGSGTVAEGCRGTVADAGRREKGVEGAMDADEGRRLMRFALLACLLCLVLRFACYDLDRRHC